MEATAVSGVTRVRRLEHFALQAIHGGIDDGGIRARCYTCSVKPAITHAVLVPFRGAWRALRWEGCLKEGGRG